MKLKAQLHQIMMLVTVISLLICYFFKINQVISHVLIILPAAAAGYLTAKRGEELRKLSK